MPQTEKVDIEKSSHRDTKPPTRKKKNEIKNKEAYSPVNKTKRNSKKPLTTENKKRRHIKRA